MTIVIAKAKSVKEIVVRSLRSLHLRNFLKLKNFIRKGLLKNLSINSLTRAIARAKLAEDIVVRSPHLRNFLNLESFTRKGPLKNLSIENPTGNSLVVKINLPNPKEVT